MFSYAADAGSIFRRIQEDGSSFSALQTLAEVTTLFSSSLSPYSPFSLSLSSPESELSMGGSSSGDDVILTTEDNNLVIDGNLEISKNLNIDNNFNDNNKRVKKSKKKSTESSNKKSKMYKVAAPTFAAQNEAVNNHSKVNRKENSVTVSRKCLVDGCDYFFPDRAALEVHLSEAHDIEHFRCQVSGCGQSYESQQSLTYHLRTEHNVGTGKDNSFVCSRCPEKVYPRYESLAHHIYAEHQVGVYRCAVPGCSFSAALRVAVSRHFERNHRAYSCPFPGCGRRFTYTNHLRTHERSHLGIKPYSCLWPISSSSSESSSESSSSESSPSEAKLCGYSSENKSHVASHIRAKHLGLKKKAKKVVKEVMEVSSPLDDLVAEEDGKVVNQDVSLYLATDEAKIEQYHRFMMNLA